ncbi:uncharacterized protein B0P05DRAFT_544201 [Gilbertella persicaria]|uniref:uncharacterized protein n=1 Tax=Gilbertella persicaria TaxID=101096 RepID=UPI00221FFD5E|nr:uncharacterized protein B0P05DRAFT_544201 [Gilbertella persicaria]KAI8077253.1 hypothetical protein B0P05DRAFT_544201 [Gilbertella persicaria]
MSQLQTSKPSLPSIQFLLQEAPSPQQPSIQKKHLGHRASRSVSSLPLDLQSLSLQPIEEKNDHPVYPEAYRPTPYGGIPFPAKEKPPSWVLANHERVSNLTSTPPLNTQNRRRSGFHGRSVSEFTLPPLASTTLSPHRQTTNHHHRRAVSANTLDFMSNPSPHMPIRAHSNSPEESHSNLVTSSTAHLDFFDQLGMKNKTKNMTSTPMPSSDTAGRYTCPYCHKKFSRPSSLRIHTYSHTGEKPFVCTEPGCGRHFSVQSNMRRHLRVHRLGRSVNNNLKTTTEE